MLRALLLSLALLSLPIAASADPGAGRVEELKGLIRDDCGACHGMTLKGGLGSPLTPEALADTPDAMLMAVIMDGRPGTPMPPWRGLLSEDDARWIIDALRTGEIEGKEHAWKIPDVPDRVSADDRLRHSRARAPRDR